MSALKETLRAARVRNTYEFYNGETPAGQVFIHYTDWVWQVRTRSTVHEKFFAIGGTRAHKARKLTEAQEWARSEFGIEAWKRDPFGSYGSAEFIDARIAELKATAAAAGYVPPALRVYSWRGYRPSAANVAGNRHGQTSEIIAAKSKAEAARLAGVAASVLREADETRNQTQMDAALAHPGVLLWAPLDGEQRHIYRPVAQEAHV